MRFAVILTAACLLAVVVSGCKDKKANNGPATNSPGPGQVGGPPEKVDYGQYAAGRKVYETNCMRCHAINGQGGGPGGPGGFGMPGGPPGGGAPGAAPPPGGAGGPPAGGPGGPGGPGGGRPGGGMGKGPDLGHVGAKHDAAWIAEYVRDPHSKNDKARMPKFPEAKINETDLKALADYLASLK